MPNDVLFVNDGRGRERKDLRMSCRWVDGSISITCKKSKCHGSYVRNTDWSLLDTAL